MKVDAVSRLAIVIWLRQGGALPAALGLCLVVLWAAGDPVLEALRYERAGLAGGDFWRVLSGSLVHATGRHLLLNLAGLTLVVLLFPQAYSRREWSLIGVASAFTVGAGLWWLSPAVEWYVGLSGVLHGLLAAGALAWWRNQPHWLSLALSVFLVGKLTWEQAHGAVGWSGDLIVIVDAHLYGALGGLLAGASLLVRRGLLAGLTGGVTPGGPGPV